MPNLVGVWAPEFSEEAIRKILLAQVHRVRVPRVEYAEYLQISPGFAVAMLDHGIFENGVQPVTTSDERLSLMFDGELSNADELRRRFQRSLPSFAGATPELCLHLIARHGEEVVNFFNGLFCLVLYDHQLKKMTLISDRFGYRPLFYVRRQKAVFFGSELKALTVADTDRRELDDVGLLEFFSYGSYILDRTWIQGYVRLSPATILTVDKQGVKSHQYWVYKYDETAPTLDQPTYFTVFHTLLDRAVERCMRGTRPIGLFLSGGYDSRAVAASIRDYHLPLPAFTFGRPEARDVRFAAMLAQRLGLDHHPLTDEGPYLYQNCRKIIWRTEGLLSFADCTSIRYHPVLKEKMDIILLGFLGEFSGSHTWPQLLMARSRQRVISVLFERWVGKRLLTLRRILNPLFLKQSFEAVQSRFWESFNAVPNDHPLNLADSWSFRYRQPFTSWQSPSVDRFLFEARAPLMDFELVKFLLTIPPYARLEQRVYKKMIAYGFPAIRDVPCTNSGLAINPKFASEYAAMAARYLGRKVIAPLVKSVNPQPALGREFRDLGQDFREEPELMSCLLQPLLAGEYLPTRIFNHAGIKELVTEHYEHKGNHEGTLSMLISWGLAAKYFLHDDLSEAPTDMFAS